MLGNIVVDPLWKVPVLQSSANWQSCSNALNRPQLSMVDKVLAVPTAVAQTRVSGNPLNLAWMNISFSQHLIRGVCDKHSIGQNTVRCGWLRANQTQVMAKIVGPNVSKGWMVWQYFVCIWKTGSWTGYTKNDLAEKGGQRMFYEVRLLLIVLCTVEKGVLQKLMNRIFLSFLFQFFLAPQIPLREMGDRIMDVVEE